MDAALTPVTFAGAAANTNGSSFPVLISFDTDTKALIIWAATSASASVFTSIVLA